MLCTHAEILNTDGEGLGHCSEGEFKGRTYTSVEVAVLGMFFLFFLILKF